MSISACTSWCGSDPVLLAYHDHEWCRVSHDERYQFEMLCLEGASVGLSWKTIMHKREAYQKAFHNFDINECAVMSDEELELLMNNAGLIRNRNKIFSVRTNAKAVQQIQKEFGSFDAYLWHFTNGQVIDNHCRSLADMPTVSDLSTTMAKDMQKRGMRFVGSVITYSFMQSIGMVNDHLLDCPCHSS